MESQDRESSDVSQSGRLGVFRNRNFTLLWAGVITSNVGSWMQIVAQGWLVYEISGSPLLLGAVAMARAVPMIVLPPVGGVAADRLERLKLLKITQAAAFVIALSQGLIVSLDVVEVWQLVALGLMAGAVNAFDQPTRQALLPELVRREHLSKAIALNSSAWQGSALFGPALAGVVVALAGVAGAFYVNAFSFLAVLAALFLMRGVRERSSDRSNRTVGGDLLAGLSYVKATSLITVLLSMAAVTSIFGRSYQLLLPIFAADIYGNGSLGLGILLSMPGAGALVGASAIAVLRDSPAKGRVFLLGTLAFSITIAWFALNRSFPLGMGLLFASGTASIVFSSMMTTMIQLELPNEMRGRVMSLLTVTMQGFTPIGGLMAGAIATMVGTPEAVAGFAIVIAVAGLLTWLFAPSVRNYGLSSVRDDVLSTPV